MTSTNAAKGPNLNRSSQAANPVDIACLGAMLILSNVMQYDAIFNAQQTGSAIWQSVLVANAIGGILAFLVSIALRAFLDDEPRDWFALTEGLSGKTGARVSAIALLVLFMDTAKMTFTSLETTAANEYLSKTPIWIITAIALLVCVVAARRKMRGVVRIARLMLIVSMLIVALILIIAFSSYDLSRLFPIAGYGIKTTVGVGVRMAGDMFCDMLILCLALPVQRGQYGVRRGLLLSFTIVLPFTVLLGLCYAMAYPVGGNIYVVPPMQQLAIVSEAGRFLQRLSPLLIFVWASAFFTGGSAMLFGTARSWATLFGLPDEEPLLWAFGVILFLIVLIPHEYLPGLVRDRLNGYIRLALFLVAVMPALVGRLVKGRGAKRGDAHAA